MFRILTEGTDFQEHVLLKDGTGLLIRAAKKEDRQQIKEFLKRVSPESLMMRFMAAISEVPDKVIDEMCSGDFKTSGCLVAIVTENNNERVVGIGNYAGTSSKSAEVAFLIEDAFQGKGISTILLERLAGLAAANGYIEFEAEVLPENQPMINVFNSSGFKNHRVWHSDTVHIEFPVSGSKANWERANLHERIAVANSLAPILRPQTVAVIGASRDVNSIGHIIFKNILNAGFKGTVYPVNPQAESVHGVKAFSSIKEIPDKIDLAVVSVPAEKVYDVIDEAIRNKTKGFVVVSAGFAEAGEEGRKRQKAIVELIRKQGARLIGPSCLGIMNTAKDVRLNASLAPQIMEKGCAGFFSHSAALGLVILDYAIQKGIGFTTFISAGNRADVSGNDILQYWEEDGNTKMAILYLETFGNPRRFVRIARRMSYKKPILCVKSARSPEGRKAAESKSGQTSGDVKQTTALFRQTGIILTETLEELFDVAVVLAHQPLPAGNKVGIIANSSGMTTIFADAAVSRGLEIPDGGMINLGAFTTSEHYEKAVYVSLINDDVHSLLVGYACVGNCNIQAVEEAIRKGVIKAEEKTDKKKPVLLCLMGEVGAISLVKEANGKEPRQFPSFRFPESAAHALAKVVRYSLFRQKPAGNLVWDESLKGEEARNIVQKIIEGKGPNKPVEVTQKEISSIFEIFGFQPLLAESKRKMFAHIEVEPDPIFGPLISVKAPQGNMLRITPLTDRDLEEIYTEIKCNRTEILGKALGRISQMIEELPWLWRLSIDLSLNEELKYLPDATLSLMPGGAKRPEF